MRFAGSFQFHQWEKLEKSLLLLAESQAKISSCGFLELIPVPPQPHCLYLYCPLEM